MANRKKTQLFHHDPKLEPVWQEIYSVNISTPHEYSTGDLGATMTFNELYQVGIFLNAVINLICTIYH